MSDLLGIIDILDNDCDLHLDELSGASVSAAVPSPVVSPNWIPFSGCFSIFLFINILFYFLADTCVSFYLVRAFL